MHPEAPACPCEPGWSDADQQSQVSFVRFEIMPDDSIIFRSGACSLKEQDF